MRILLLILLIGLQFPAFSQTIFSVNPSHSKCSWMGSAAVGLYKVEGTLDVRSGSLEFNDKTLLTGQLTMDMQSLETENKQMKKHLKGKDFFETKNFPMASFQTNGTLEFQEGDLAVPGAIEIKGIRQAIVVPLKLERHRTQIELTGILTLDRTDFGITYNSPNFFENVGDQAISDEIEFRFHLVFDRE